MLTSLRSPQVLRCYFDDAFVPRLPAMDLRWDTAAVEGERHWQLPDGVTLLGPPPERFGVQIRRRGPNSYNVRLLWDRTGLTWDALSRDELLTSALVPLLAALGTDLWYLLEQPIAPASLRFEPAA